MSITFYDKKEALKYQENLRVEGIDSKLDKLGNKWLVSQTGNIQIKVIDKKTFEEGTGAFHYYNPEDQKHEITIPPKASTMTKLHEVGHSKLEHKGGAVTMNKRIDRELDAETYAIEKMGRNLDYKIGIDVFRQLIREKDMNPISIVNIIFRKLEERGIEVTTENKKWFIDTAYAKTDDPEIEQWKEDMKEEF